MSSNFSWKSLGKLYLYFFYFSGLTQILIYAAGMSNTVGIRQALFISTIWLVPNLIWPQYTRKISAFIGLLIWPASLVSLSYFYIYGQDFSQSVLFIIFESNVSESKEFIESYLDYKIILLAITHALTGIYLWRQITPVYLPRLNKLITICIVSLIFGGGFLKPLIVYGKSWDYSIKSFQDKIEPAAPWNMIAGYFKYTKVLDAMNEQLAESTQIPPLSNLVYSNNKQTMVLVIGESTNSQRMSLYGYSRHTTPQLDNMRRELLTYTDVISPRPSTIEALQQVLTFADQKNPDVYLTKPTLINMMRQAGYKSLWITNQQTQTKRNTLLLTFSQQADEQVYLNNNRVQNSSQLDDGVLKPFKNALSNSDGPTFIVVHLLGTHRKYNYRYPESFKQFTGRAGMPDWVPDEHAEEYNDYDNAILFNDYVVSSLINILKETSTNSSLVYFSDHGEEVYDTKDDLFCGRNEGKPTPAMYTVPFIAWLSPEWKKMHPTSSIQKTLNHPYQTSDFIYSWADLAGIDFIGNNPTRSIFNKHFIARKRMIGSPFTPKKMIDFVSISHKQELTLN
ncbi:MAG: heptose-I-phosphate ethanolaminephosphotransferase [Cycloclasticus pugetii]|jgi:heptose-I-phosphate ethanolaminephosphotransferase|uniref:phosphoethanolamine transferase CptA n=1 Tax=Cycloclasticus TaxID=34067 RepID=UPI00257E6C98|nr:phosphoethanolamine transferase CptA [Cycloclasticus sp.]MBV1898146.1 phosphoethanolamine transferase CptA [Cycloclasticus sp.]